MSSAHPRDARDQVIRRKFANLKPDDALFEMDPVELEPRPKRPRVITTRRCPQCGKPVSVIREAVISGVDGAARVFAPHRWESVAGLRWLCQGSGQPAPYPLNTQDKE